jgi:transcription elongation factor S-II
MPPAVISAILLTQKAEIKAVKIPATAAAKFSLDAAKTLLKKKEVPDTVVSYPSKSTTLFLFGYSNGKAGTENKHELPPPHDTILFFGDCLVIASKDSKSYTTPVNLKPEEYETFYTKAFGGFEDLDEDEEDEEDEDLEDAVDAGVDGEDDAVEEGKEFDEEDEEEEEEEEAPADEEEDGEVVVAAPKKRAVRKSAAAKAAAAAIANAFTTYVAIAPEQELQADTAAATVKEREACLRSLQALFKKQIKSADAIAKLEACIYKATLTEAETRHVVKSWSNQPFVYLYQMCARHIAANFLTSSYVQNSELWAMFKNGNVSYDDIAKMTAYDMAPARWKESFDKQQIREKSQLEGNRAMATDQFLCTRCWKRECTYYEMQTRSADEPMTIFITCINCGKHWRQ